MGKAELTKKIIGMSVKALRRTVPEGAVTYDYVRGIGPKGKFTVWSFKDSAGKLTNREIVYGSGTKFNRAYYNMPDSKSKIILQTEYLNNKHINTTQKCIIFDDSKKCNDAWMYDINFKSCFDRHKISYLSPGKSSQSVSYATFWDGDAPIYIETVTNTGKELPNHNLEYLPLVGDFCNHQNINSKINHISTIQEKKFDLEGITPPVKRVSSARLNETKTLGVEKTDGHCIVTSGQIEIDEEISDSKDLLRVLGHEYRHAYDFSNGMRFEETVNEYKALSTEELQNIELRIPGTIDFYKKSLQKGIIPKDSELGKEVKIFMDKFEDEDKLMHDERYSEILANNAGAEETGKLDGIIKSLMDIFNAKFWWRS